MVNEEAVISAEFPFESKYIEVLGSKVHYIDEGQGDPIVFLHGLPASCYVWRNIVPAFQTHARCIAPDLIGLGKSDKPDIGYTVFDHIRYIEAFVDALKLKNITFVLHAWGSVIGFDYARRHEANVKALAFVEAHVRPATDWSMVSLPVQELASVLEAPDGGYDNIMHKNYYIDQVLQNSMLRRLTPAEKAAYQQPFLAPGSCKPLWQYAQELPLGKGHSDVVSLIEACSQWLQKSHLPKLMLYAIPGYLTTIAGVQWARDKIANLELVDVGDALHYPQEANPAVFREELLNWYRHLEVKK